MVQTLSKIPITPAMMKLFLASKSQLGGSKSSNNMKKYIFGQSKNRINIFDIGLTWEKLVLAARACAAIKNPEAITAISGKTFGRKPVLKFAEAVGAKPYTGRFIPGSFTNTNIKGSCEPRLIIVSDPITDKQAIMESAGINCPVIAFCNTDADLSYVDIAIPINNRSPAAIGVGFFVLSRLIAFIKNGADIDADMKEVELYFYRDASELEALMAEQNADNAAELASYDNQQDNNVEFGQSLSGVALE